ncbi:hypothetical protein HYR99_06205 [Candidatus Poribacteria bacterium]|nr:hypothetical protein [Candidatus Poribacteria bacterium]
MIRRYLSFILLTVAMLIPTVVSACPTCNLIEDPIFRGFNWSILFLMAMPFTVFGIIGGSILYTYKRGNKINNQNKE